MRQSDSVFAQIERHERFRRKMHERHEKHLEKRRLRPNTCFECRLEIARKNRAEGEKQ